MRHIARIRILLACLLLRGLVVVGAPPVAVPDPPATPIPLADYRARRPRR